MASAHVEVDQLLKTLLLKDLRVQTRVRGLNPAGGVEALRDRLKEHMLATGDFALKTETGEDQVAVAGTAGMSSVDQAHGNLQNNYNRPAGQNVGNFITDRPSSRVLAPPGGGSQIVFGDAEPAAAPLKPSQAPNTGSVNPITGLGGASGNNNYARPGGQQNVGNFLTDKPSSRVLAPPGGGSQIVLG